MIQVIDKLTLYFQYPFVTYALIVGVLIALCSALLGVTLVLKRFSFIGDGLSHVAFGAMAIASIFSVNNNIVIVAPITIVCAILLLHVGQNAKVKGDAIIAALSVGALALGYLLMNIYSVSSNIAADVCTTLFGATSILTLSVTDVWISIGLSLLVVLIFVSFYHKIFAITFDENFALATGTKAHQYNMIIAVVTALVVVLAMNLVGSLLTSALIVFPSLSAMRVFKSFKSVIICAVIFSITGATLGILISILAGTPVGSTIVVVDIIGFIVFSIVGMLRR